MSRRTLVLADLHLTRRTPASVTDDLVRVVAAHAGQRIVFAGDLFDLSAESPPVAREHAIEEGLAANPAVRAALARHVDRDGELWMLGGNHDAEVGLEGFEDRLVATLGIERAARPRVLTSPWFLRDGALHVEHGHLYDPDNAPAHPLVVGKASLGVHFVEQFLAPTGAWAFLNSNDGKPLELFLRSFKLYGLRAPYVIYRFFHASAYALRRSGPFYAAHAEWPLGAERLGAYAERLGLPLEMAEAVLAQRATPTLESFGDTFARLYLDRVGATLSMVGGLGALSLGRPALGGLMLSLGAIVMAASWAKGHDRYRGSVSERLAESASRIVETTGAKLVVFGHTHHEEMAGSYANTGSFSFPRGIAGRPFLEIEGSPSAPRPVRRYLKSES